MCQPERAVGASVVVAAAPGAIVGAVLEYSAIFGLPASLGCCVSLAAAVLEGDLLSSSMLVPMGGLPAVHTKDASVPAGDTG